MFICCVSERILFRNVYLEGGRQTRRISKLKKKETCPKESCEYALKNGEKMYSY